MRIAIAGASGTGKTTLAQALAECYRLPINPVGSRQIATAMGFASPYDVDRAGKRVEFQRKLFLAKREWESEHESFVTDRTYFDNLTYCALHMARELPDDSIAEYARAMERYDLVFYLPRRIFQSQNDDNGVRLTSSMYHEFYERILTSLLCRELGSDRLHYLTASTTTDRQIEARCRVSGQFSNEVMKIPPVLP